MKKIDRWDTVRKNVVINDSVDYYQDPTSPTGYRVISSAKKKLTTEDKQALLGLLMVLLAFYLLGLYTGRLV